jgi:hypothetical protein
VGILSDDTFLCSEMAGNLFVLRRNTGSDNDDERYRLESAGAFHVGDIVNVLRDGSLVMAPPADALDTEGRMCVRVADSG